MRTDAGLAIGDPDSMSSIREAIERHYREFPEHGSGCACIDPATRALRMGLNPLAYDYATKNRMDAAGRKALNAVYGAVQNAMKG